MKVTLAFLVVLALSRSLEISAVPINEKHNFLARNLKDDLNDFLALVPVKEIEALFYQYLAEDEDFGEALDYVLSEEFQSLVIEIESMSEVKELLNFLQASGLDAYGFINRINDLLGIDHIQSLFHGKQSRITGGLPGFIQDVKALLPIEEIEKLYNEKLQTSDDFAALVQRLKSQEFQGLVDKLMANHKLQELMRRAEAKGVDVQAILDFFTSLLGLKFPTRPVLYATRNLKDDLNDFLALVPVEEIKALFYQYLAEDEDFGEALDYVLSEEFQSLVIEIESMAEVKELLNFLQASGLDAYGFINRINDLLGIDHIQSLFHGKQSRITGGLPGFIQDVKALLPTEEIEKLYNEKLQTSDDFAALVQRLKSQEFQGLVDKLMVNHKLQELMRRAEAKGVDVQAILDFFTSLLGLKFPTRPVLYATRNLKDDLNDFLALVPVGEIKVLFYQYLAEDDDFEEAVDYVLLSEEFQSLVTEIESMAEVRELLNFLQASGLDAYGFINRINDFLGIDHIQSLFNVKQRRITGGLPGFIQDVKALLPIEEIEKLYNEKLQTSDDFAALVQRLKSQEFQGLVDKLILNHKLQELMRRAEAKGVDVQAILDFFTSLLGLKFPTRPVLYATRNLKDDLNDFLALVPVEEIKALFYQYLAEDEDFGEALDYVLSEEFQSLVIEIESMAKVRELLNFLQASGLDAYGFINRINDLLGIDHIQSLFHGKQSRITGGLPGFIQDVKALLPTEEIEKLYNEKLQTSNDFAALVQRLKSQEFQGLVDQLMANPNLQELMRRAEAKGVDVQAILDFFTSLLGLKFPTRPLMVLSNIWTRAEEEEVIDILRAIWAQVPMDDIFDVIVEYLLRDEDFKRVVKYMMSDEFKHIVVELERLPELKALAKYFNDVGMDIYTWVDEFHGLIGLESRLYHKIEITGGVRGLLQDIRARLPLKQLRDYYDEKLETSSKFKEFIRRLETQELQQAVDALGNNADFNMLLVKLEKLGVIWDNVVEIITAIIGIKFPERPL